MKVSEKYLLNSSNCSLVVIDVQEKLCNAMNPKVLDKLVRNSGILLEAAKELSIPVLATEQYVKGLGSTLESLSKYFSSKPVEKMTFSCCGEDSFNKELSASSRKQVIVTGMETHVCVLQTVIQLLQEGYIVHAVKDAVMSRHKENWEAALSIFESAGAIVTTTEAALFQLLKRAGTDEFRKLSKLVR